MATNVLKKKDIKREKLVIDATDQILGRLAVQVAKFLMGKHKAQFVTYLDTGDFVVVTNASKIKVTGKKLEDKRYFRHSGYPHGLRSETLSEVMKKKPERVIEHAVKGMLPKNRLGAAMFTKLKVFSGEEING
jgi:large subunit ribosomal protein L13